MAADFNGGNLENAGALSGEVGGIRLSDAHAHVDDPGLLLAVPASPGQAEWRLWREKRAPGRGGGKEERLERFWNAQVICV